MTERLRYEIVMKATELFAAMGVDRVEVWSALECINEDDASPEDRIEASKVLLSALHPRDYRIHMDN